MYSKELLITNGLPPIFDSAMAQLQTDIVTGVQLDTTADPYTRFIKKGKEFFSSSQRNRLSGWEKFPQVDITMGCHHFIDNLIIKYGLLGLQIFEHDYRYYTRLNPNLLFAKPGSLDPGRPVLISAPIPGYLDLHPEWNNILAECQEKSIPVHIDGCWLGAAKDIQIDLAHKAIHSIGLSLSKGLGMGWNRVGLRWSLVYDETDSICIMNNHGMIPESLVRNGLVAMNSFLIDYLWDTYENKHKEVCYTFKLRPTKIIHAAHSIDRSKLYGLSNIIK